MPCITRYYDAYQWIMDNAHLSREINWPYRENDGVCNPSAHYNDLGAARLMKYVQVGGSNFNNLTVVAEADLGQFSTQ